MRENPKPYEVYRHFKGDVYQVITIAKDTETGEEMVVYRAMYDVEKCFVRPLASFISEVDKELYPNIQQKYRFELISFEAVQNVEAIDRTIRLQSGKEESLPPKEIGRRMEPLEQVLSDALKESKPLPPEEPVMAPQIDLMEDFDEEAIAPALLQFLEADSYESKLYILTRIKDYIDDQMINTIAMSLDLEISDGSVEEKYNEIKNCLITLEKYECNRLR